MNRYVLTANDINDELLQHTYIILKYKKKSQSFSTYHENLHN